jgi:hypothetical protein
MPLKLLIDEDVLGLADALREFSSVAMIEVDVIAVGDGDGPPRGTKDLPLLAWAERHERIIVTGDRSTMQRWLGDHLQNGGMSPGVFILKLNAAYGDILSYLAYAACEGLPEEFENQVEWIP